MFTFVLALPARIAGNALLIGIRAALNVSVPLLPAIRVNGETVISDGRLVRETLIGPLYEPLPTLTDTGNVLAAQMDHKRIWRGGDGK